MFLGILISLIGGCFGMLIVMRLGLSALRDLGPTWTPQEYWRELAIASAMMIAIILILNLAPNFWAAGSGAAASWIWFAIKRGDVKYSN